MQGVTYGGLSGKARQVHKRRCASRVHTQQLIDDYLEPAPARTWQRSGRAIPIHHRYEPFLPSSHAFEHVAFGHDGQLDLPFAGPATGPEHAVRMVPVRPHEGEPAAKGEFRAQSVGAGKGLAPQFTIRGFLCGCAVGAAAAAIVLMVLQTVLR